jgi:hypothetical protein
MKYDQKDCRLSDLVDFFLSWPEGRLTGHNVNLTRPQAIDLAAAVLLEAWEIPFDSIYSFVTFSPTGERREWVVKPGAAKRGKGKRKVHLFSENIKVTRVVKSSGLRPKPNLIKVKRGDKHGRT